MMPAMRMPAAVTAEMAAAVVTTSVVTTAMPASMTTAMTAAMTAAMAAFRQRRSRQHAGKCQRGNSNDRSHHCTLPRRILPLRRRNWRELEPTGLPKVPGR